MQQTNPFWLVRRAPRDLQSQIHLAVQKGFQVVSQTSTTAQLIRKKHFSCLLATILFLLFTLPFIIYLFYFLGKKDDLIYLDIERQPTDEELVEYIRLEQQKNNRRSMIVLVIITATFILIYLVGIIHYTQRAFR